MIWIPFKIWLGICFNFFSIIVYLAFVVLVVFTLEKLNCCHLQKSCTLATDIYKNLRTVGRLTACQSKLAFTLLHSNVIRTYMKWKAIQSFTTNNSAFSISIKNLLPFPFLWACMYVRVFEKKETISTQHTFAQQKLRKSI